MARTYTGKEFAISTPSIKMAMLVAELSEESRVSKALAGALEKTTFAAAAMMRAIDRHVPKDLFDKMMADIGTQYDGFGAQAREALKLYRESKR